MVYSHDVKIQIVIQAYYSYSYIAMYTNLDVYIISLLTTIVIATKHNHVRSYLY